MPHGELSMVHCQQMVDAASVQPAVYEDPADLPDRDVARALNETMVRLVEACNGNPTRIAIAVARCGNMSYAEIASRMRMSREAVFQQLMAISVRNARLSEHLRSIQPGGVNHTTPIRDVMRGSGLLRRYRKNSRRIMNPTGLRLTRQDLVY